MMIHAKTRKRTLVDKLYSLGISVSYSRVKELSKKMENKVLIHYAEQGLVCPPSLKFNLFTTVAFDNIDHSPSSTVLQQRKIPFTEQLYHYSSTKLVNMMD